MYVLSNFKEYRPVFSHPPSVLFFHCVPPVSTRLGGSNICNVLKGPTFHKQSLRLGSVSFEVTEVQTSLYHFTDHD